MGWSSLWPQIPLEVSGTSSPNSCPKEIKKVERTEITSTVRWGTVQWLCYQLHSQWLTHHICQESPISLCVRFSDHSEAGAREAIMCGQYRMSEQVCTMSPKKTNSLCCILYLFLSVNICSCPLFYNTHFAIKHSLCHMYENWLCFLVTRQSISPLHIALLWECFSTTAIHATNKIVVVGTIYVSCEQDKKEREGSPFALKCPVAFLVIGKNLRFLH